MKTQPQPVIDTDGQDMIVAETILSQLGGAARLTAMIGARQFAAGDSELTFKFAAPATNGANCIQIVLDASDTYEVIFHRIGRAPKFEVREIGRVPFVYDDQLIDVIESETGLRLSVGRIVFVGK